MTPVKISIAAAIASLLLILIVLELIRGRRLKERYALMWLVDRAGAARSLGLARRAQHDRRLVRCRDLPAGDPLRGRDAVHHHRVAALLDGALAARRPEHGAGPAAGAARAEVARLWLRPGRPPSAKLAAERYARGTVDARECREHGDAGDARSQPPPSRDGIRVARDVPAGDDDPCPCGHRRLQTATAEMVDALERRLQEPRRLRRRRRPGGTA